MRIETNHVLLRLGLDIRARRSAMNLTQSALARRARTSVTHISGIERGRRSASVLCLARIAKGLQTTLEALCKPIDERSRQTRR